MDFSRRFLPDALVRVGQEAVTNAEQHSGCDHLTVRVETSPHAIALHVTDDGTFHHAATSGGRHFGMRAMHAAVDGVGGRLEVGPASPGTHVHAVVAPWAAPTTCPTSPTRRRINSVAPTHRQKHFSL